MSDSTKKKWRIIKKNRFANMNIPNQNEPDVQNSNNNNNKNKDDEASLGDAKDNQQSSKKQKLASQTNDKSFLSSNSTVSTSQLSMPSPLNAVEKNIGPKKGH
jgi:hypothetical protein